MFNIFCGNKCISGLQKLNNRGIGIKDLHAGKFRHIIRKLAVIINRRIDIKPVPQPAFIVISTMTRGGVDITSSCIQGYVISRYHRALPVYEGMKGIKACYLRASEPAHDLNVRLLKPGREQHSHKPLFSQQPDLPAAASIRYLNNYVFKVRMHCHSLVGWKCPGGSSPDKEICRNVKVSCNAFQFFNQVGITGELYSY